MKNILLKLVEQVGLAGDELAASSVAAKELAKYADVKIDKFNNVIATFGNLNSSKHILLDAHIDQVGMIVTYIDEKGFISVNNCGGIDKRILPSLAVKIHGKKEIKGVFSSIPPHLSSIDSDKFLDITKLSIDTGLKKEEIEELVSIGDRVSFDTKACELLNNRISSPGIDDRAGVAAILHCVEILSKQEVLPYKVTVLLSVQEETSALGAKTKAFEIEPTEAIILDVSFATQPDINEKSIGEFSGGPMIGISPILSREMSNKLISLAQENSLSYQLEVMSKKTGTNADSIAVSKKGVKCALLSIPIRYMHTPCEVVDLADIENTGKLLAMYIKDGGAF